MPKKTPCAASLHKGSLFSVLFLVIKGIHSLIADLFIIHDLLRAADKEDAAGRKILIKSPEKIFLRLLRKIDQHVSANDQMTISGIDVLQKVVLLKRHALLDLISYFICGTNFGKVVCLKLRRNVRDGLLCIKTDLCLLNTLFINVRGIDLDLIERKIFRERHDKGIGFLARGASCTPYF